MLHFKGLKNQSEQHFLKFREGHLESFRPIYERFSKPIFKYVIKHVRVKNIAEEITQDIFLKIYQYRKSYDPQYEISKWIWTITRNTVYDHLRQIQSQPLRSFSGAHSLEELFPHWEPSSSETAETLIFEELEKRKLTELMNVLSAKQKEAIFLRLVKRFSYQEISNTMNLSLSAVKSLINRGKTTLIKLQQNTLVSETDTA